jgi:hypothetical protein
VDRQSTRFFVGATAAVFAVAVAAPARAQYPSEAENRDGGYRAGQDRYAQDDYQYQDEGQEAYSDQDLEAYPNGGYAVTDACPGGGYTHGYSGYAPGYSGGATIIFGGRPFRRGRFYSRAYAHPGWGWRGGYGGGYGFRGGYGSAGGSRSYGGHRSYGSYGGPQRSYGGGQRSYGGTSRPDDGYRRHWHSGR